VVLQPRWDALKFTFDSLDASVASITRGDAEYKLTSPGVFVQDKRNTIRSIASGYRCKTAKATGQNSTPRAKYKNAATVTM